MRRVERKTLPVVGSGTSSVDHRIVVASQSTGRRSVSGVDLVGDVGLVVLDVEAARLEQLPRTPREADLHDRIGAPVRNEHARVASRERRLPVGDTGTKPENARIPAGAGRSSPSPSA